MSRHACLLLAAGAAHADAGGHLRLRHDETTTSAATTAEAELRGTWRAVTGATTLAHTHDEGHSSRIDATVNELYVSGDAAGWSFSGGRKIVSWDVGFGFRPNDVVQQERRRVLLPPLLVGKAVVMAERFGADDAWSLVGVDPVSDTKERALAARYYRRVGSADWHVVARHAGATGSSLGTAVSWVATDTLEVHGSVRWAEGLRQGLAGFTWTGESKLSVNGEAWYDGAAPSDRDWANPRVARGLAASAAQRQNQRRRSVFARIAWEQDGWEPALDHLWLPADRSHVTTASLGWRGDRVRLDGGVRRQGGPAGSLMATNPVRHIAFAAATWSF